ncbi:MAG: hypothetical protein QOE63_300 [Acidimicrobiaceae bacterium]|jgi:hypothetical protein
MANYVLAYRGGAMAATPEEQKKAMDAWTGWFGSLGDAVVDGGAPFGPSSSIAADGSASDGGASALTGYSILSAASMADVQTLAKGCPVLASGGTIEVYESLPM